MKKIFLVMLALGLGLPMGAKQIDAASAQNSAKQFCRSNGRLKSVRNSNDLQLSYTAKKGGDNLYYVFNNMSGNGFVVVSADDCTPTVLGYSENGSFDINTINDNLRYWLGYMGEEIAYAISEDADGAAVAEAAKANNAVRYPVAPLVSSKWNQSAPYNNLCPMYNESQRCVTGCVATAMAQVMYANKWPNVGSGTHSYTTEINGTNTSVSMNFAETTFDWDNMIDVYDSSSSDAQNRAVATLMKACGVSTDMGYGLSSGTQTGLVMDALVNYFDYDNSMRSLDRHITTGADWEDIVYTELQSGRPVVYAGRSNDGGHCFVCDGYSSDGYFHFNWGWGGTSDGYYLLTALNPGSQGIGGSATGSGYNSDQQILYNIKPQAGSKAKYGCMNANENEDFKCNTSSIGNSSTSDVTFKYGDYLTFDGYQDVAIAVMLAITNEATGKTTYIDDNGNVNGNYHYGTYSKRYIYYCTGLLKANATKLMALEDGTYTIKGVTKMYGSDTYDDINVVPGRSKTVTMKKDASGCTFTNTSTSSSLKVNSLTLTSELYAEKSFVVDLDLTAKGYEYVNDMQVTVNSGSGRFATLLAESDPVRVAVSEGNNYKMSVAFNNVKLAAGTTYTIKVLDSDKNVAGSQSFVAKEAPKDAFAYTFNTFGFADNNNVNPESMVFTAEFNCTAGFAGGTLRAIVYEEEGSTPLAELSSVDMAISAGRTFTAHHSAVASGLQLNKTYRLSYFLKESSGTTKLQDLKFKTSATSGINGVKADVQHEGEVRVYDVQGRELYKCDAADLNINDVDAEGVLIIRSAAGVSKVVK